MNIAVEDGTPRKSTILLVALRFGIGAVAAGAALVLRIVLTPLLGLNFPYITFFPAVIASAALGGFGAGLVTTGLGALSALYFIVSPRAELVVTDKQQYFALGMFVFLGAGLSWFQELFTRSRRRAIQAESAQRNQRRLYQQTLAGIGDGVISTDSNGRVDFMNRMAEQLAGWTTGEAKGHPIESVLRIVDEEAGGETKANTIDRVLRSGIVETLTDHVELVARNGKRLPVDVSGAPIVDDRGSETGSVIVFRNVEDRRRSEKALQESERRLRAILESITDAFVAFDSEWRFTYANHEAERVLGRPRSELIGRSYRDVYPQARDSFMESEFRKAVATQSPGHFEVRGPDRWTWLEISAFPASGGGLSVYFRNISHRKTWQRSLMKAKRDAESARDLLETTLASIGDAVITTDSRGRITFLNSVAAELTGWPEQEAVNQPLDAVYQIFDEASGAPAESPREAVFRENQVVKVSSYITLRSRNGAGTPIDQSAAPIRDRNGNEIGVILVFRDITERRRTLQALERSEERLRLALDAGEIGVWDWNIIEDRLEWSERVYEIHGVAPENFGGRVEDFTAFIHPEEKESVTAAINRALRGEDRYEVEFRIVRPNGRIRWISTSAKVIWDDDKRPVRMLGATVDLTERHEAELALRESEARLQFALDVGRMATWDWDMTSNTVSCSASYYRLLGLEPDIGPLSYEIWAGIVHADDRTHVNRAIAVAARENRDYRADYRVVWPDHSIHWLEARGQFFYDRRGRAIRMVGVVADVTDRKIADEALLKANEELQHFAYAASHDLQEPLRTITSFSQLLVRQYAGKTDGAGEQFLHYIVEGTTRMQSLIQGMLALSRAGGRETAPLRSTSSTEVLASTLETLQAAIEEASAEVVFEELPVVLGDAAQLTQVFQNLISNAIKYRRPGQHPRIRIWAERENEHWRFGVQDNGLGFPQALADRIFAPFRRLHGPEIPGAGIGLALCRRIIDRHRGRMWAESQEGTGATFYFTLPAAESTSAEANR